MKSDLIETFSQWGGGLFPAITVTLKDGEEVLLTAQTLKLAIESGAIMHKPCSLQDIEKLENKLQLLPL